MTLTCPAPTETPLKTRPVQGWWQEGSRAEIGRQKSGQLLGVSPGQSGVAGFMGSHDMAACKQPAQAHSR